MSSNSENESWIKELRSKIVEEDDKILFDEASGCFLAGHFRGAYILSWISLVESLKRKLKLLSNLGDKRAIESDKKIEDAEDKKNSADKLIFEEAKKCGIIDSADLSTISYLWEQRCLFAHPYNKQPDPDEIRHIIGQTIKLVLGRPLVYNKDFLLEHAKNIATKPFFLPTEIEQIQIFAKRTIARTPESLHPFFFKTLLFQISSVCLDENKINEFTKLRVYMVELFKSTSLSLADTNWALEDRFTTYPFECIISIVHKGTWQKLPSRIKEMVIGYIESETESRKLLFLKYLFKGMVENEALEPTYVERYHNKLASLSFESAREFYGNNNSKFKRLIEELLSFKYEQQNSVIDYLRKENGGIFIKEITTDEQFYLGRLLRASAINGHWKSQNFIQSVASNSIEVTHDIKAGIAFGSFIDTRDKFSLNKSSLELAIQLLNQVDDEIQNEVYELIDKTLDNVVEDEWDMVYFSEEEFTTLAKSITESIRNPNKNNISQFDRLVERIKSSLAQKKPLKF